MAEQTVYQETRNSGPSNNWRANLSEGWRRTEELAHDQEWLEGGAIEEKRLGKNRGEFYKDIDSAIEQCGIDPDKVSELNRQINNEQSESRKNELMEKLNKLTSPAFYTLLEMGYTSDDLSA